MAVSKQQEFVSSLSLGSQEYHEYFCQPCNKEGNHIEAEGYCENCREFLCRECYKIHRRPTALQHHVLLDKKNMTKYKPPTTAQDVITDRCLQHADKLVEYFCSVHKTMACHACIILNHRNCDPVQFIPHVATDIQDSQAANAGIRQRASAGQGANSKISVNLEEQSAAGTSHVTTKQVTQGPVRKDPKQLKAKTTLVTDINVKSSTDNTECRITGATIVGHEMIFCDWDNRKVKLMDTKKQAITSELKVSGEPWTVAEVDHNQVVVTIPYFQKIAFLKLTDKLKLKNEMKVNGKCFGIVYTNDMLVITFSDPGKVEVLDMQGHVLHMIDRDSQGRQLFSQPEYVAVDQDGQLLYISDEGNQTVTCVTVDGAVKGVYTDSDLISPRQLTVDTYGNVFVCGFVSHNIHVLNSQCQKIKVLLSESDGLWGLQSLCYNQKTGMLYVGTYNNNIQMYPLSYISHDCRLL